MGSSASKGAGAAGATVRKYPTRPPQSTTMRPPVSPAARAMPAAPEPTAHAPAQATGTKTQAVELDARDPAFASRLSRLGAVQPNPHYSNTSASEFDPRRNPSSALASDMMQAPPPPSAFPGLKNNPVLRALEARQRIADEAEDELREVGRRGFKGRKYADAGTIQLALMRRVRGEPDGRIEDALGIKRGRLAVLGKRIVEPVSLGG